MLLPLFLVWCSAPVFGQAANEAPADTAVVPIPGITVTGARSPEAALKTPAAQTVIPRGSFEMSRQISLADALDRVPSVFTQSRAGAQDVRITIRGYGARGNGERSNAGNMRGIRVMTDGIPLTEPDGRTSLELVDLGGTNQIEVLRSNGAVLYGNASGGVVHLRTSLNFPSPYLEFQERAGAFGYHREQGVLGYTLGSARASMSAYNSHFDGWREHSQSSTTSIQNRATIPIDEATRLGLLLDFVSNFNRYPGPLTQAQLDSFPEQANPTFVARDERRFNRVGRVGATFAHDMSEAQHLSAAAWVEPKVLQRSERNRFRDFTRYHVGGNALWSLETPVGSNRAIWTVGGDEQFQDGSIQFYTLEPDGSRGTGLIQNKREGANSAGVFAQAELRVGPQWSVRLATRYDNLWYISEDRIDPTLNAAQHFTHVTPKGSIARYFSSHTLYASIGGGVEAPAFNEIDPPPPYDTLTSLNPFLEPMQSTTYEVGAKGTLVKEGRGLGRVGYDVALYWIDVTNDIVPFNGGAYFFTAGKSRRRGGELGLDWTPVNPLTVRGALTLSNNEYVEYENDLGNFDGNEVAGLPSTFADGEVRWRLVPGFSVAGRWKHVDDYFVDDANTASVEAFDIFGAEAEYTRPLSFGSLRAFVAVENLSDEDYVASAFINGINGQYFEPGLPRNVSAGLTFMFR